MNRARVPFVVLAASVLGATVGCDQTKPKSAAPAPASGTSSSEPASTKPVICLLPKKKGVPYFTSCAEGAEEAAKELGVELIEQPFPADADDILETLDHPIPVCADESCHTTGDLHRLKNRYDAINIKLDKTGGLTEALQLYQRARENNFKILIGCMVCTSLSIAPARLLASNADWVDLDGPLLLARDRDHGLAYRSGRIGMPVPGLWG